MAAICCEITNMGTKARAKLETWRPRPVRNKKHGDQGLCEIRNMAAILVTLSLRLP